MIYQIIEELRSDNSRLSKENILERERNNELLKRVLEMTLNPRKNYYIKKLVERSREVVPPLNLECALDILENKILSREVTGHAAHEIINSILDGLHDRDSDILRFIIARDLKCGVSTATVNKIWPCLIPDQPYQRCALLKDMKKDKIDWNAGLFSQEKLDGMFCNIDIYPTQADIVSRNGSPFPPDLFGNIISSLRNSGATGYQFHGELLVEDMETEKILPREVGNGLLNSVLQSGTLNTAKYKINFITWDMVKLEDVYTNKKTSIPYSDRFNMLKDVVNKSNNDSIKLVETRIVYSLKEALKHYTEKISFGGEGTILKIPSTLWKDGNSLEMFKFKVDAECDLRIVGFNEGNGKNSKTFGSIICESSCGKLVVNVAGFTDADREEINSNRNFYIDKIIPVVFNNIMHSEGKKSSLFLPRKGGEVRLDKTEADSLEQIQKIFDSILKDV